MRLSLQTALLGAVVLLFVPVAGAAQICVGLPSAPGDYAATIGFETAGNSTLYDASVNGYIMNTVFAGVLGGVRTIDGIDETAKVVRARVGTEVASVGGASICPVARIGGERIAFAQLDQTTLNLGVGAGVGTIFHRSDYLSIGGEVGLYIVGDRSEQSFDDGFTQTRTATALEGEIGFTFSFDRFFVFPNVGIDNRDGTDAIFGLQVGAFW